MPGDFPCRVAGCTKSYPRSSNRLRHERSVHGVDNPSFRRGTASPPSADRGEGEPLDTASQGAPPPPDDSPFSPYELPPGGGELEGGGGGTPGPPPRRRLFDRLRGKGAEPDGTTAPKAPKVPRLRPVPLRSRRPLSPMLEGAIDWVGKRIERAGEGYLREGRYEDAPVVASIPVGRSFALVAPVAAQLGDDAIKGTVIDRALQPIVAKGEELGKVVKVLELPVLIGIAEGSSPMLGVSFTSAGELRIEGPLAQELYDSVEVLLLESADVVAKKDKKRRDGQKKIREAYPGLYAEGIDPVMQKIADIFRPVGTELDDEAPAGPRAQEAAS